MGKVVVFKPADVGVKDNYQSSVGTNYYRDQTTGELFKTSGNNVRTILPEQFKSAKLVTGSDYANNTYNNVYTVPAGKVFILTSAFFWQNADALSTGNDGVFRVDIDGIKHQLIEMRGTAAASNISMPLTYSALMVFDEGDTFEVGNSTAKLTTGAGVIGYEIAKSEYLGIFN